MKKNNLDEFFREKFKEFDEVPDEQVWEAIESSLDKKRKKRGVVPIWWQLGGIAALLAVILYIVNPFEESAVPAVVNTETKQEKTPVDNLEVVPDNTIIGNVADDDTKITNAPQTDALANTDKSEDEGINTTGTSSVNEKPDGAKEKAGLDIKSSRIVAAERTNQLAENKSTIQQEVLEDATKRNQTENVVKNVEDNVQIAAENKENIINIPKGIVEKENSEEISEAAVAETSEKKSIFDEIDQEEEIIANTSENKWSVGPSVAPVYFSSFGEGSPIHSNFVSNSKSGSLNLSYGLSVSYAVSKKLSVRSGVHKVDYGYNTDDIQFSSSLAASTNNRIDNIDYALTSKNLVVQSSTNVAPNQDAAFAANNEIAAPSPTRDGRMVQQFGYIEVPVELNYALVDRKLGVNLIGGVSSLFLIDNTVSLESDGAATDIGEANNINSLNFSTNIGVGLNYDLSSKVKFHLEPMFKYQLNTFSDTAGSFQPFSVGVYSGLNFKF